MKRKIIKIEQEKCNGCGLCIKACHEGAIGMENGRAVLLRDDYCDGLGDCLPQCPTGAISFEEREALAYDEKAVTENRREKERKLGCGCPGSAARAIERKEDTRQKKREEMESVSRLRQWPVQIKLAPVNAPYFHNASLLIAADCTAYAYGDFHEDFIKNKITLIGCPKLDEGNYAKKLAEIIKNNDIKSVTVVKMEVPCCKGIENAVREALIAGGKMIPWSVHTISTDGRLLEQ